VPYGKVFRLSIYNIPIFGMADTFPGYICMYAITYTQHAQHRPVHILPIKNLIKKSTVYTRITKIVYCVLIVTICYVYVQGTNNNTQRVKRMGTGPFLYTPE